jgi:hypothetical protein
MFHYTFTQALWLGAGMLLAGTACGAPGDSAAGVAGLGPPVAPAILADARGGAAMAASATLSGTVSSNSAVQVVTGSNAMTAGSFAGASGIPIVIQNTGANVLIQNATVINVQFTP